MAFWIDSGFLIASRRKLHTRECAPQFWFWLDEVIDAGTVRMPLSVYSEITAGNDWLAAWVKARKPRLCTYPNESVQRKYTEIADTVEADFRDAHQKDKSYRGADLWVIAHAACDPDHGTVVSEETPPNPGDNRVKIPDVCSRVGGG